MSLRREVLIAAQEAGRLDRPNPVAREDTTPEALEIFHAWHIAKVERELGVKLLPGPRHPSPTAADMMICRPKNVKGDEQL